MMIDTTYTTPDETPADAEPAEVVELIPTVRQQIDSLIWTAQAADRDALDRIVCLAVAAGLGLAVATWQDQDDQTPGTATYAPLLRGSIR